MEESPQAAEAKRTLAALIVHMDVLQQRAHDLIAAIDGCSALGTGADVSRARARLQASGKAVEQYLDPFADVPDRIMAVHEALHTWAHSHQEHADVIESEPEVVRQFSRLCKLVHRHRRSGDEEALPDQVRQFIERIVQGIEDEGFHVVRPAVGETRES